MGCATNQEKMSKHLSNSERLRILEEYFASDLSKYAIEKKHAQHERQEEGEPRPQSQAQGRETGPQSLQAPLVEPAEDTYGIEIQKKLRCQVVQRQRFYRTKKVAKFPHMRKYIFVYTPINFLIYGNIFPYIHKYISLYTQQREARNIAPELYNYRRMNPEQRAKSACVNLRGNTNRQL